MDYIVGRANELGQYIGRAHRGRYWNEGKVIFDERNAETYGRFIAERYKDADVIWILGGDRNPDDDRKQAIIRAMARGIRSVDTRHLITFHPTDGRPRRGGSTVTHGSTSTAARAATTSATTPTSRSSTTSAARLPSPS